MPFTIRFALVLFGWNFLPPAPAVAAQTAPTLDDPTIRYGLTAAMVGLLLLAICLGVIQFSRDEAVLRRARSLSGWSFAFSFAALAGSLVANYL
jgi:hypothetical protein